MKNAQKLLAMLLAVCMVVALFAACGKTEAPAADDKAPAEGSEELVLVEGTEKNYYVYKCSLCGQWIVAYYVPKTV